MANTVINRTGTEYNLVCKECGHIFATASEKNKLPKVAICPNCDNNDMLSKIRAYNETRGHLYANKLRRG
jgi:uncharacterized Zn finger protein